MKHYFSTFNLCSLGLLIQARARVTNETGEYDILHEKIRLTNNYFSFRELGVDVSSLRDYYWHNREHVKYSAARNVSDYYVNNQCMWSATCKSFANGKSRSDFCRTHAKVKLLSVPEEKNWCKVFGWFDSSAGVTRITLSHWDYCTANAEDCCKLSYEKVGELVGTLVPGFCFVIFLLCLAKLYVKSFEFICCCRPEAKATSDPEGAQELMTYTEPKTLYGKIFC